MIALLPTPIVRFLTDGDYAEVSARVELVVILLATGLLIEKVLVVAIEPRLQNAHWGRWMTAATFPLLMCLGLILVLRFLALLG
jgi:hypothetical protein